MKLLLIATTALALADAPTPAEEVSISEIAYAKDGSFLVAGGTQLENGVKRVGPIQIWDGNTGRLIRRLKNHSDEVTALALSPDGRRLVTSSNDMAVWLWDLPSNRPPRVLQEKEADVTALAYAPDGRTVAIGSRTGVVRIRDIDTNRILRSLLYDVDPNDLPDDADGVNSIVFTHDGTRLAAGGWDRGAIRVWEVATGEPLVTIRTEQKSIHTLILSPDGRALASSGDDGTVRLWDSTTGAARKVLRPPPDSGTAFGPEDRAGTIAFSPDGAVIAAVLYTGEVRLWDVKAGRPLRMLHIDDQSILSVAFSPDGKTLVTGSDTGLQFWDWPGAKRRVEGAGRR